MLRQRVEQRDADIAEALPTIATWFLEQGRVTVGHNAPDLTPIHNRRDDDDAPRQDDLARPAAREHAVHEGMDLAEVGERFPGRDADRLPEHLSVCLVYANEDVARAAEFREQNVAGHAMSLQAQDRQPPEHRLARPGACREGSATSVPNHTDRERCK
jgi:hypothetical protein